MPTRTESRPAPSPESLPQGDVVSPWPPQVGGQEVSHEPLLVAGPVVKALQAGIQRRWEAYKEKPLLSEQDRRVSTIEPMTSPYPHEHTPVYNSEPLLVKGPYAERASQKIDEFRDKHPIKYQLGRAAAVAMLSLSLLGSVNAAVDDGEVSRQTAPITQEAVSDQATGIDLVAEPAEQAEVVAPSEVEATTETGGVVFGDDSPEGEAIVQADPVRVEVATQLLQEYGDYIQQKAEETGIPAENIAAIILSESDGSGFNEDGSIVLNFESDDFEDETGIDIPSDQGQSSEQDAFDQAVAVDPEAAHWNTSFGMGQIMGWNAPDLGYPSAQAMKEAFSDPVTGPRAQMDAILTFITNNPETLEAARNGQNHQVARNYNGPAYHRTTPGGGGEYHLKLIENAAAYQAAIEASNQP